MPTSAASIEDRVGVSAAERDLIISNANAAFAQWAANIISDAVIDIRVVVVADLGGALANAGSTTSAYLGKFQGKDLFSEGAAFELMTGKDPNGPEPDITITLDYGDIRSGLVKLDVTPFDDDPATTSSEIDAVSVFAHEIGHALFLNGWHAGSDSAGLTYLSTFDRFLQKVDGQDFYAGPNGVHQNGGPVLLESGNHVAHPHSADDLMQPSAAFAIRLRPSSLDLAMMADNNIPTIFNDTLVADPDGGRINAGPGLDTVVILSDSKRASFATLGDEVMLTLDSAMRQSATLTLQNVERVSFDDVIIAFDDDGNAGQAYRLYQAAFNRTPDQQGLSYWVRYLDSTSDLGAVAQGFVGSAEFQSVYGSSPTNLTLVNTFYRNVLGRTGEADGISHWTGVLERGVSVATVLAGFSESPENQAAVAPKIVGGITLSHELFV